MEKIRDFFKLYSDRRPGIFGLIIVLSQTLLPMLFVAVCYFVLGYGFNSAIVIWLFTFVLEIAMLLWTERPVIVATPFIIPLAGIVLIEIINFLGPAFGQLGGDSSYMKSNIIVEFLSYVMMTVFGSEVTACFAAVPAYLLIKIVIAIWEKIKYR